jgi:hypothetical protein
MGKRGGKDKEREGKEEKCFLFAFSFPHLFPLFSF